MELNEALLNELPAVIRGRLVGLFQRLSDSMVAGGRMKDDADAAAARFCEGAGSDFQFTAADFRAAIDRRDAALSLLLEPEVCASINLIAATLKESPEEVLLNAIAEHLNCLRAAGEHRASRNSNDSL